MSDLKILFPHIPFFGIRNLLVDGEVDSSESSLFMSGGVRSYRIASTPPSYVSGHGEVETLVFKIESLYRHSKGIPLATNNTPRYLLIIGSSVGDSWELTGTTGSGTQVASGSVATLYNGNVMYADIDLPNDEPYTEFKLEITRDVDTIPVNGGYPAPASKVFLGVPFDFGINPIYASRNELVTQDVIAASASGVLTFRAVETAVAKSFVKYILPYFSKMTFVLDDADNCIFSKRFTYCLLSNSSVVYNNNLNTDISFQFLELL